MSGHPDDHDHGRNDPDREAREGNRDRERGDPDRDGRAVAAARAATAAPGLFLILNGLFGLVCAAILFVPMVLQPEMILKFSRDMVAQQPPGPERKDAEEKLDEADKQLQQNKAETQIRNAIELGLFAVTNLLAVLGGFAMRSLGSYGLSMAGAIVSIIPMFTGCCCTGILFGIWSLVVLMRPEVKAGFAARRRASYSPDSY